MKKHTTLSSRLSVEALENRTVPTVSLNGIHIFIEGSEGPDDVTVSLDYLGRSRGYEYRVVENGVTALRIPFNPYVAGRRIAFLGKGGNDTFRNLAYLDSYANGMDGSDTLYASYGHNHFIGGNGQDYLYGGDLDDVLSDQGTDFSVNYLYGGGGNDSLTGSSGDDSLFGGNGTDTLAGLDGNDWLEGGNQNDYLFGGNGHDYVDAGSDYDWNYLVGGEGNDYLVGGHGIDYLHGENGQDTLIGGAGNDELNGGYDGFFDYLVGGTGSDWFHRDFTYGGWYNLDYPADPTAIDHWAGV